MREREWVCVKPFFIHIMQLSSGSRSATFGLSHHLRPNCMYASSECSGKTADVFTVMHGSRKFNQRGSNSDNIFGEGREGERIQIALKVDQHRPVMAFRWRADDGPTLNAGLVAL